MGENSILLYANAAGKETLSLMKAVYLCYEKACPSHREAWAGSAEGMCDDGSKGGSCSAPQMSLTAWVGTHTLWAHLCVVWLGGELKVPAKPLVRKLQKAVSQRELCACPPYGVSCFSPRQAQVRRQR